MHEQETFPHFSVFGHALQTFRREVSKNLYKEMFFYDEGTWHLPSCFMVA